MITHTTIQLAKFYSICTALTESTAFCSQLEIQLNKVTVYSPNRP